MRAVDPAVEDRDRHARSREPRRVRDVAADEREALGVGASSAEIEVDAEDGRIAHERGQAVRGHDPGNGGDGVPARGGPKPVLDADPAQQPSSCGRRGVERDDDACGVVPREAVDQRDAGDGARRLPGPRVGRAERDDRDQHHDEKDAHEHAAILRWPTGRDARLGARADVYPRDVPSPGPRIGPRSAAVVVLAGVGLFWGAMLVAAAGNPGYSHRRDYVSTLAAHGAERGWLGVTGVVAAAVAILAASAVLRPLSRTAAISIAAAGIGFLVAAFTRLECSNGAAGCGLGGRFAVAGSTEVTHWTATTVSSVLVVAGMVVAGVELVRGGRSLAGVATFVAAATTAVAFLATGGQSPGVAQRLGILVATGWLAAVAIAALVHGRRA